MPKREAGWTVTRFADKADRMYITPEDVEKALLVSPPCRVRADVLAVIGRQTGYGAEDVPLCAFVAWNGKDKIAGSVKSEKKRGP